MLPDVNRWNIITENRLNVCSFHANKANDYTLLTYMQKTCDLFKMTDRDQGLEKKREFGPFCTLNSYTFYAYSKFDLMSLSLQME